MESCKHYDFSEINIECAAGLNRVASCLVFVPIVNGVLDISAGHLFIFQLVTCLALQVDSW